jgi:cytochrome c-type biogenesis protein CcmH
LAWLFWIVAGLLAAAAAAAVALRARAAARGAEGAEDPALGVYRRQLSEIDDLAARGLLGPEEHRAAFAEAGRRLLAESDRAAVGDVAPKTAPRRLILAAVAGAVLVALGLYVVLGSPGAPDQPFRARLAAWRSGDPSQLKAPEMAAVLKTMTRQRPNDPQGFEYLARASLAANDPVGAVEALRTAIRLSPDNAELHAMLGEALIAATEDNAVTPAALNAFRQAVALDPQNLAARFFLARARIEGGDAAGGVAEWRAMQQGMAPNDPRRQMLDAEIAKVMAGPQAQAIAQASAPEQAQFIRGMVANLAARLKTAPDDPDGWARLVRAYGVLGDKAAQSQALDGARKALAGHPADLGKVEAEASGGR